MAKKSKIQPESIHFADFRIIKGMVESPFEFEIEQVKDYAFQLDFELGFQLEEKLVKADFSVEILSESEPAQQEARGAFHFVFIFVVDNFAELATQKSEAEPLEVDGSLGSALASIAYSTSRGILMSRLQGTALQHFILPVIDPNILLEE
jgi:hypothetical protein